MWELLSYEAKDPQYPTHGVHLKIHDWDINTGEIKNSRPYADFPSLSAATVNAHAAGFAVMWVQEAGKDAWCATRAVPSC